MESNIINQQLNQHLDQLIKQSQNSVNIEVDGEINNTYYSDR